MAHCFLLALFLSVTVATIGALRSYNDPEEWMDAYQLIASKGYPAEEYTVTTQDGYRLTMHRIPHGINNHAASNTRPIVFLQHGLLCDSTNWITNLANESLGFILADAGFDVWMGNFRGSTYGRKHATLSTNSYEFWQFSWDEMALHDLPTMIDFVLDKTQQESLYYVGHSEGTMTAFAKFSDDLQFSLKIKKLFALAPLATVKYIKGVMRLMATFQNQIDWLAQMAGYNEFLPNDMLMKMYAKYVCGWLYTNPLCSNMLFLVGGVDSDQLNTTRIPVYMSHAPAGTSLKNVLHFGQMVNSGLFQRYDYGSATDNIARYNQTVAPQYYVENMQVPTVLFWGQGDFLADPSDVATLIPKFRNLTGNYGLANFNHLDFVWGLRAADDVYLKIVDMINADVMRVL